MIAANASLKRDNSRTKKYALPLVCIKNKRLSDTFPYVLEKTEKGITMASVMDLALCTAAAYGVAELLVAAGRFILCQHEMLSIVNALKGSKLYFEPLNLSRF